jgi:hypothetical protein
LDNDIIMFAGRNVLTFPTMWHLPRYGAEADGTFLWAAPFLAAQAFVAEKPVKTFAKFRERKTFIPWKTVNPPDDRDLVKIFPDFGDGL